MSTQISQGNRRDAGARGPRWLAGVVLSVAAVAYAVAVLVAWEMLRAHGDRWWPATLLLFGPRWVLVVPGLALVAAAWLLRRWRTAGVLGATGLIVVGPIMGLRASPRALADSDAPRDLRIMTHNLGRVSAMSPGVVRVIEEARPDIVVFQECAPGEGRPLELPGYASHAGGQLCLLSRFPIRKVEARDRRDVWERGGSGAIVRYEIEAPAGVIHVLNLHLETVRDGLMGLRYRDLGEMDANIALRTWESELARGWAERAGGPLLIAGDLNMPVESAIYREHWSSFENAFSVAGSGWGATKRTRWFGVRIDHILAGPGWECLAAWVGPPTGSDHLPLLADYRRVDQPRSR